MFWDKPKHPSKVASLVNLEFFMTITLVPDKEKGSFLEQFFRNCIFDIYVFTFADRMLKDYVGGSWDFFTATSDEGVCAFLAPIQEGETVTLCNIFSGDETEIDLVLAGMILTCYGMEYAINTDSRQDLLPMYDLLKDTICQYCSDNNRMDAWMTIMD